MGASVEIVLCRRDGTDGAVVGKLAVVGWGFGCVKARHVDSTHFEAREIVGEVLFGGEFVVPWSVNSRSNWVRCWVFAFDSHAIRLFEIHLNLMFRRRNLIPLERAYAREAYLAQVILPITGDKKTGRWKRRRLSRLADSDGACAIRAPFRQMGDGVDIRTIRPASECEITVDVLGWSAEFFLGRQVGAYMHDHSITHSLACSPH
jgi:hypothetical protein